MRSMSGEGAAHLAVLARAPRPAGSPAEGEARNYAEHVLRCAGFTVHTEPFSYSSFPGRFATPVGGALLAGTIALASTLALNGGPLAWTLGSLGAGVAVTALFVRRMLGDAVLDLPWMRRSSANLVATRGAEPRVWLVAHLDSKSQPVPSLGRVAGITLLALGLGVSVAAAGLELWGGGSRMLWWAAMLATAAGAPAVMASVVGASSPGAVDNASGVAAVLAAASSLGADAAVGVLLPSGEELGLAGARAWARSRAAGVALNCDGVDDEGRITIMYTGTAPSLLLRTLRDAAAAPLHVQRMPLGLLTDSVALADRGWSTVTVSQGSLATLRRVHTPHDSLANLRGTNIDAVAALLARAAEALA